MDVTLRQARESDIPFLQLLRNMTMNHYLTVSGIATDETSHLDRIRYHFNDAKIVYYEDNRIGLFKFYFDGSGWHIVQIQILPEHQGKGIAAQLLTEIQKLADDNQQNIQLSVLKSNPAKRLYQKLRFTVVAESDNEFTMLYEPLTQ